MCMSNCLNMYKARTENAIAHKVKNNIGWQVCIWWLTRGNSCEYFALQNIENKFLVFQETDCADRANNAEKNSKKIYQENFTNLSTLEHLHCP